MWFLHRSLKRNFFYIWRRIRCRNYSFPNLASDLKFSKNSLAKNSHSAVHYYSTLFSNSNFNITVGLICSIIVPVRILKHVEEIQCSIRWFFFFHHISHSQNNPEKANDNDFRQYWKTTFWVTKCLVSPNKVSIKTFLLLKDDLTKKPILLSFASESLKSEISKKCYYSWSLSILKRALLSYYRFNILHHGLNREPRECTGLFKWNKKASFPAS